MKIVPKIVLVVMLTLFHCLAIFAATTNTVAKAKGVIQAPPPPTTPPPPGLPIDQGVFILLVMGVLLVSIKLLKNLKKSTI